MKIGIYANLFRDLNGNATKALFSVLGKKGVEVLLSDELRCLGLDARYYSRIALARESDVVVVFGGDGTILRIARECARYDAMIFAVNLGHRGFLAESDAANMAVNIEELLHGNYVADTRTFLEVRAKCSKFYALNEVVLARGTRTKVMKSEVRLNGALVDRYTSDGIIISTPTGSTAYNLSAGGPIIAPDVDALVITPISAHSLHSRPIVVNNKNEIWVEVQHAEPHAHLNIDGEDVLNLADGDTITVTKSDLSVRFMRLTTFNYYEKLLEKMRYWSSFDNE